MHALTVLAGKWQIIIIISILYHLLCWYVIFLFLLQNESFYIGTYIYILHDTHIKYY